MLRNLKYIILVIAVICTKSALAESFETLDKVVAVVNTEVITESELETQINLIKNQLRSKGVQVPPDNVLRKQVLQHLIDVDLQLQLAKNYDVTVDSTELDATINKIAEDNTLTLSALRSELRKQGMTWDMYRDNLRKEIIISRMQQKAIGKDIEITPQQVEDYLHANASAEKSAYKYHIQNIVVPLEEEPTTKQINKALAKAQSLLEKIKKGEDFGMIAISESSDEYALEGGDLGERYLAELPEVFAKKIIDMKPGQVAGPIRTGNGFHIIKLVSSNAKNEHHHITKTHVRHILLKQDVSMTNEEALNQANSLYEQLKSGKDFAVMAKQYSLDAASASKGGDLGWVVSDELVKPFADAMIVLPLHTISKPVKSQFGWHLIEVLERKKIDDSDAYKRQQVRMLLQQRKFNEAVQNWQQHIRTQSYVNVVDKKLA
ncbi:MAG: molecular chaperone SurA [Legionellales bacterium RIFCSPHIGHO2_12_FULL_35_11]|nr:MAG: molecular chaperone SurA [Legionellales bacterium RIFCSPHIGHO2_12_FULL_35_11]